MSFFEHWIKFIEKSATSSESIAYLNKICYVAYTEKQGKENWATVYSADEVDKLEWIDDTEKNIIKKAFDNGATSLFIRGAVNEEWGKENTEESPDAKILPLQNFLLDGKEVPVDSIAFTIVISPRWSVQKIPSGFSGVLVNTIASIPTTKPATNIVNVYDPMTDNDKATMDGKALGIMSSFLSQPTFKNMQLQAFTGYTGIPNTGLIDTLMEFKATFLCEDANGNVLLGMFSAGGDAITKPYIKELWKYNVREALRKWIQVKNPEYIDANLLVIEDITDKISQLFMTNGYFESYKNTVVPTREEQLASDIDNFIVNNVDVEFSTTRGIWGINFIIEEGL